MSLYTKLRLSFTGSALDVLRKMKSGAEDILPSPGHMSVFWLASVSRITTKNIKHISRKRARRICGACFLSCRWRFLETCVVPGQCRSICLNKETEGTGKGLAEVWHLGNRERVFKMCALPRTSKGAKIHKSYDTRTNTVYPSASL